MSINSILIFGFKKASVQILMLNIAFFAFSFIEVCAEFSDNITLQHISKPLILPFLMALYWLTSKIKSPLYLAALFFNWLANILFVSINNKFIILASIFFLLHRVLILIKIFKDEQTIGFVPIVLGGIPFLFLFLSLINLVYQNIFGGEFFLILFQVALMTLLGGFSLAKYIIKYTISSKILMISSLFFGMNLFVLGIKYYYFDFTFLKPIAMIFFVFGHYTFYYFIILKERVTF